MSKKRNVGVRIFKSRNPLNEQKPLQKAETPTQLTKEEEFYADQWIEPPTDLQGFQALVNDSAILPQCIRAYRHNIAGFGIDVRYVDDVDGQEETPEMKAEYDHMKEVIECLTLEDDTKEIFEDVIEARETYGIAYVEVIRNNEGEVTQLEFVKDTATMRKTRPLDYQDMTYYHHGQVLTRKKRFRIYRQQVGGKTIYFKEFGDPRVMDNRDGNFLSGDGTLEAQYQANEILEFAIGTMPYGTVRWIGQVLGVDGSRRAERLNNNYFRKGRHTPLAIILSGGTLSDQSYEKLQEYIDGIEGENGQHAFLLLETESTDTKADFEQDNRPAIELKDLANILQKDELFQDYMENNRRKVQSAFQLPDLYVAYTTDSNRATSQTAREVTEEQVFQPERDSLAWILNNKLLNGYQFRYVEAFFQTPNISNPDDLYRIMTVTNAAGGLTPNKAKDILYKNLGETSEDYEGDWGNEPLARTKASQPAPSFQPNPAAVNAAQQQAPKEDVGEQLEKAIEKAVNNHDEDIVTVLKEVKSQLKLIGGGNDEAEKTV